MAGADEIDGAGWQLRLPAPRRKPLREYKVAVMLTDPSAEVDREVQDRLQALADFLAKKKARVSDRARPDIDTGEAHRVYIQLLRSATSAGRRTRLARNLEIARRLAPRRRELLRAHDAGNTLLHRDWLAFDEARHKMRWKWHDFFEEWDLLLCPPAASAAFPHDQQGERYERTIRVNGQDVPTTDQLFWAGYPGRGIPARDGGADRLHAVGTAGGRPDRRPAVRRPHHHRLRPPPRARVPALHAAPGYE